MSSDVATTISAWCGAICTFAIFSILYRENRYYRLFEHIFIGLATGYGFYTTWSEVLEPDWWKPLVTEGQEMVNAAETGDGWQGVTTMQVKEGVGAIRWDPLKADELTTTAIPHDWSATLYLRFWMFSEGAPGLPPVRLALETDGPENAWVIDLPVDYFGWRAILLHRSEFRALGQPDWARIERLRFFFADEPEAAGEQAQPPPRPAALHLDDFRRYTGRGPLVREGRIAVSSAHRPADWTGAGPPEERDGRVGVHWDAGAQAEITTEAVRTKDWATVQYVHVWLHADQANTGSVEVVLSSEFEDPESPPDEQTGERPKKTGAFRAPIPLGFTGWQEVILHRSRFAPEGEANWQKIVRLGLAVAEKDETGRPQTRPGLELLVGDVTAYTGRTGWTLTGEEIVNDAEEARVWTGGAANYLRRAGREKEQTGAVRWEPAESPQATVAALQLDRWPQGGYFRFWAAAPGSASVPVRVAVHTAQDPQKQTAEEAKDEPRGEEMWIKVGDYAADVTLEGADWRPYTLRLQDFATAGEPDWKSVTQITFSVPEGQAAPRAAVYLDDLAVCSGRKWYWIFALMAGLMYYTIYSQRYAWFSRLIIALMMGLAAGAAFKGFVTEMFPQVSSSFKPLWGPELTPFDIFSHAVFILTLFCVLVYFFFSFEHRAAVVRGSARLGRWLLMIYFGVVFGNTVMARFSLFINRLQFLIQDWWPALLRMFGIDHP